MYVPGLAALRRRALARAPAVFERIAHMLHEQALRATLVVMARSDNPDRTRAVLA